MSQVVIYWVFLGTLIVLNKVQKSFIQNQRKQKKIIRSHQIFTSVSLFFQSFHVRWKVRAGLYRCSSQFVKLSLAFEHSLSESYVIIYTFQSFSWPNCKITILYIHAFATYQLFIPDLLYIHIFVHNSFIRIIFGFLCSIQLQ